YMPPEQAEGKIDQISPASDVYALGAILYEMLTGHPPFQAPSAWETLQAVLTSEPVAPRSVNRQIPRDLDTICLKCLSKSPLRRYQLAQPVIDDLVRWLDGRPIVARPASYLERTIKWIKRHPALAVAISLVTISLVVVLTTVVQYNARL